VSDVTSIVADLVRCKQRIENMTHAGPVGRHDSGIGFQHQLDAQRTAVARLELEYVTARLSMPVNQGGWLAAQIITAMEPPALEVIGDEEDTSASADTGARIGGGA